MCKIKNCSIFIFWLYKFSFFFRTLTKLYNSCNIYLLLCMDLFNWFNKVRIKFLKINAQKCFLQQLLANKVWFFFYNLISAFVVDRLRRAHFLLVVLVASESCNRKDQDFVSLFCFFKILISFIVFLLKIRLLKHASYDLNQIWYFSVEVLRSEVLCKLKTSRTYENSNWWKPFLFLVSCLHFWKVF